MWIKEHEFARVKLADQKYKSKRKFSLDLTKNFGVIISTIYFSANFFSSFAVKLSSEISEHFLTEMLLRKLR